VTVRWRTRTPVFPSHSDCTCRKYGQTIRSGASNACPGAILLPDQSKHSDESHRIAYRTKPASWGCSRRCRLRQRQCVPSLSSTERPSLFRAVLAAQPGRQCPTVQLKLSPPLFVIRGTGVQITRQSNPHPSLLLLRRLAPAAVVLIERNELCRSCCCGRPARGCREHGWSRCLICAHRADRSHAPSHRRNC
jgi:hypothetical protein